MFDPLADVADAHDHAEGRGLPIVRALGDAGAGWGLVPPGAIVLVRTIAELTSWGAAWTQETSLAGRLPVGIGTSFSPSFAEATDYGTSWAHNHTGDDHTHTPGVHFHSLSAHTHDLQSHTHAGASHTHDLQSHTHSGGSHTHGMGHTHPIGLPTSTFLAAPGGVAGSTNVGTSSDQHGGNTGASSADPTGTPSASTSGGPSNNTSTGASAANTGGPSNNTSNGPSNNTTGTPTADNTGTVVSIGVVGNTSWLPPMRGVLYARKV